MDGGQDADHGGDGVAYESAAMDMEGVEDAEEVVDVGVEIGVAVEVEVVRINTARTNEIIQDDLIVALEIGKDALPRRLVGAEAMGEDEDLVAGALHPDVEDVQ